jgi:hypothetical protein
VQHPLPLTSLSLPPLPPSPLLSRYIPYRAAALRQLLAQPGILRGPCCHDALSAKLIEQAGFPYAFMSGFCTSAARIGAPDTGLMSYGKTLYCSSIFFFIFSSFFSSFYLLSQIYYFVCWSTSRSPSQPTTCNCTVVSFTLTGEVVDVGRTLHEATRSLPIIGDGDTGYGNAMNVQRTVRGFANAGFAGILIEDQVAPKSCGHVSR